MPPALSALLERLRRIPPLDFVFRVGSAAQHDQLPDMAAKMAYYFMLSLFPGLILLVAILDALPLDHLLDALRRDLEQLLPGPAAELIGEYLSEFGGRRPSGFLSLWGIAALWAASRGMADARKNLDVVFGVARRRSTVHRLVSFPLTMAGLGLVCLAYVVLVGGPEIVNGMVAWAGVDLTDALRWKMLRWPVVLVFLTAFVVFTYRYLPASKVPFRPLIGGAIPVVVGWISLGLGFRFYLSRAGRFDEIYGSLASVIVLLVFLWAFSLLFLLGGAIAAQFAGLRRELVPRPLPEPREPNP